MAASNRIVYSSTSVVGGMHVANAVRYALLAQQEINLAANIANQVTGAGVTPANLEGSAEFGAAAGQGATLLTAITNLATDLNAISTAQIGKLFAG